jgi:tRNA (cytidine/uridine-2'-O-)-methyltransferase
MTTPTPTPTTDLHVVLVEPEIHWNTGNAGRTCLAAGAKLHLVAPLGFSLEDKEVRRAGLDYWPRVAPRLWADWATFEQALPSLGVPYLFTARAERRFQDVAYARPAVLIFGRESVGLDARILARRAEETVAIPMRDPELRSLNLSTSVALALYEVRRQWGWSPA